MTLQEIAAAFPLPIKVSITHRYESSPSYYYLEKIIDGIPYVGWNAKPRTENYRGHTEMHNYKWEPPSSIADKFIPHPEKHFTLQEQLDLMKELRELL